MDFELLEKVKVEESKNHLKILGLKETRIKKIGSLSICCQ